MEALTGILSLLAVLLEVMEPLEVVEVLLPVVDAVEVVGFMVLVSLAQWDWALEAVSGVGAVCVPVPVSVCLSLDAFWALSGARWLLACVCVLVCMLVL